MVEKTIFINDNELRNWINDAIPWLDRKNPQKPRVRRIEE